MQTCTAGEAGSSSSMRSWQDRHGHPNVWVLATLFFKIKKMDLYLA
jgi:hypothetical protein